MNASVESVQFNLPDVAAPFATVNRLSVAEGVADRNRPHYHPDTIEFCTVVRGQLDWFVAEDSYVVQPGETLVMPANVIHGAVDANLQPCELAVVHLMPEFLPSRLASAVQTLESRRLRLPEVAGAIRRIVEEHERRPAFLVEIVASLAVLMVTAVLGHEETEEERTNSRLIRQAQRAMLGKNGMRPTVDDVADRLGVSSVWLHKLFVRETGVSPGEWARAKRLTDAKRMLEEGQLSTVAIAMELGYATGQSFATAFKRESGMSPSDYRALHALPESERKIYCVEMRETWRDGVRIYPPSV